MIEVEAKFRVPRESLLIDRITKIGGGVAWEETLEQDEYFNHPARDFVESDEALRIRGCGPNVELTWKGPRLDAVTKSRRELELPLESERMPADQQFTTLREMLLALGFVPAGRVRKRRRATSLLWSGHSFKICIDEVDGLPLHAEIETLCEEAVREQATAVLLELARELQLQHSERRSYIHLVKLAAAS